MPLSTSADHVWLDSDFSNLGVHKPYEWAEDEVEQGKLVKYISGRGLVIDE